MTISKVMRRNLEQNRIRNQKARHILQIISVRIIAKGFRLARYRSASRHTDLTLATHNLPAVRKIQGFYFKHIRSKRITMI